MGYRTIHEAKQPGEWPHGVGCEHCRAHRICNECGGPLDGGLPMPDVSKLERNPKPVANTHCTNGRCYHCHNTVCGSGQAHAPYRHSRYVRTAAELAAGMSLAEKVRRVEGRDVVGHNQDLAVRQRGERDAAYIGRRVAESLHEVGFGRDVRPVPQHPARRCAFHGYDYVAECNACAVFQQLNESDERIARQDEIRARSHKHGG